MALLALQGTGCLRRCGKTQPWLPSKYCTCSTTTADSGARKLSLQALDGLLHLCSRHPGGGVPEENPQSSARLRTGATGLPMPGGFVTSDRRGLETHKAQQAR